MAPLESLERLVETWALEQPIRKRRMLVIVNPYATTVSDRLRNLVVHALQSRYEVTAFDTQRQGHATELIFSDWRLPGSPATRRSSPVLARTKTGPPASRPRAARVAPPRS